MHNLWLVGIGLAVVACHSPQTQESTMSASSAAPASTGVATRLSLEGDSLRFTVTNSQGESFKFCNWHTPLEGFYSDMFEVLDSDGEQATFLGILAKRAAPDEEDYVTLAPRANVSAKLSLAELAENYKVDSGATYKVRFLGAPDVNALPSSNAVEVRFE